MNYHAADASGKIPRGSENAALRFLDLVSALGVSALPPLSLSLSLALPPRHNPEDETHGLRSSVVRHSLAIR